MHGNGAKRLFVVKEQIAEVSVADPRGVLQHGLEHRLQLARRTADDLQHLGGRRLLLQRLAQLARARLHLVEQPRVLDRDHRLVGEGRDQLDLFLGEGTHLLAPQDDHADRRAFPHERNSQP